MMIPGRRWLVASGVVLVAVGSAAPTAKAHGFIGDRFLPPTIATDDPFAVDELALPTVSTIRTSGPPSARETDIGASFSKEILPRFALAIAATYVNLAPNGMPSVRGFDDLALNAKLQLWQSAPHEALLSVGVDWDIGGTGAARIGADPASVITPTIYFGKGLGDLPDALEYARPFAITGTLGEALPTSSTDPYALEWGFALEYSLRYLQSQVKDVGLPPPFKSMIPVVELALTTPESGGGATIGTVNPGLFYENNYFQLGAEAIIPVNRASGTHVGVVVQLQLYLDDVWPGVFGHPLIGRDS